MISKNTNSDSPQSGKSVAVSRINKHTADRQTDRQTDRHLKGLRLHSFCRLGIQMDENDALKEALNSTLKAKEEDLKLYQELVEQTKKIFLQGLRQFRQGSAPS